MTLMNRRDIISITTPFYRGAARSWPFYSHRSSEVGCTFSNLYPCPVKVDTHQPLLGTQEHLLAHPDGEVTFASTEHIFQCAKALHARDDLFCRGLKTNEVARCGQGRLSLNSSMRRLYIELGGEVISQGTGKKKKWIISPNQYYPKRPNWGEIKIAVMWIALTAKFEQHPRLWGERLTEPQPSFFIEHTTNDSQWGDGGDGEGTNFLGKLLTMLLWQTQRGEPINILSDEVQSWLRQPNLQTAAPFYLNDT